MGQIKLGVELPAGGYVKQPRQTWQFSAEALNIAERYVADNPLVARDSGVVPTAASIDRSELRDRHRQLTPEKIWSQNLRSIKYVVSRAAGTLRARPEDVEDRRLHARAKKKEKIFNKWVKIRSPKLPDAPRRLGETCKAKVIAVSWHGEFREEESYAIVKLRTNPPFICAIDICDVLELTTARG